MIRKGHQTVEELLRGLVSTVTIRRRSIDELARMRNFTHQVFE